LVNDAPAQRIRRERFALIIDDSEWRLGELVDVPVRAPANEPSAQASIDRRRNAL
jgi:hypothetical protein